MPSFCTGDNRAAITKYDPLGETRQAKPRNFSQKLDDLTTERSTAFGLTTFIASVALQTSHRNHSVFDADQCADCDRVVGIRASMMEDAVFPLT
jgi:translation elongation factor EF-1alpha